MLEEDHDRFSGIFGVHLVMFIAGTFKGTFGDLWSMDVLYE